MRAAETRQHAREALQGKWGKAALTMLVYGLLTSIISGILNLIPIIGPIANLVITIPLTFGFVATLIKLKRGEDTTYTEFFTTGFSNFASSWKVTLWTCVKLVIPIVLIIVSMIIMYIGFGAAAFSLQAAGVPLDGTATTINVSNSTAASAGSSAIVGFIGIIGLIASSIWLTIKGYLFKPVFFILFDNPNKTAKEIVEESAKVMNGNRWKWFCLELSFIGWLILAVFTLGIGMLWIAPYMIISTIVFYEFLFGKKEETAEPVAEGPVQETIEEPKTEA